LFYNAHTVFFKTTYFPITEKTMSSNNFRRLGGISLILSGMLTISTFFTLTPTGGLTPVGFILDVISYIFLIPGFLVLSRQYKSVAPAIGPAAIILCIAGFVVFGLLGPLVPAWENMAGLIGVLGLVLPIMLFGISFYRYPELGMPRILGMVGILTGIMGIVNVAAILSDGGDWQNAGNTAMETIIFITYAVLIILGVVWCIWTGLLLLSPKSE
jgi:hypothetical protein